MKTEKPIYSIPKLEVILFGEDLLTTSGISFHGDPVAGDKDEEDGSGAQVDYGQIPFNQ